MGRCICVDLCKRDLIHQISLDADSRPTRRRATGSDLAGSKCPSYIVSVQDFGFRLEDGINVRFGLERTEKKVLYEVYLTFCQDK
jgi:hypothetical protein